MENNYPDAFNKEKVGTYSASVKSGADYFYDEVLEYRVWLHPERGAKDLHEGNDYYYTFPTFKEANDFVQKTDGTEEFPMVLILQREHINEPSPGVYEHIIEERITEWRPEWLKGSKREENSIRNFLKEKQG